MKTAFTIILNFFAFIILAQVTVTELSHPTAIPSDQFGSSASISDDFAAVGAYLKNDQIGTVSIFKRENDDWVFSEELSPSDNFEDGLFGRSCAMTNKTLIVGAPGQNWPNDKIGQAYIYTKK